VLRIQLLYDRHLTFPLLFRVWLREALKKKGKPDYIPLFCVSELVIRYMIGRYFFGRQNNYQIKAQKENIIGRAFQNYINLKISLNGTFQSQMI
jgi:hypothetical protein